MKKPNMFQPAILLSVLCLIVTLLLAATNELTKEPIALQKEAAALEQMQNIFPEGETFSDIQLTDEQINIMAGKDIDVNQVKTAKDTDGVLLGYVFVTSSQGYAGAVVATTGIDPDGLVIMVSAAAADDTPGLGKRVEEEGFLSQFAGIPSDTITSVTGDGNTQKIDSVSGATISSKAASAAVNKAIGAYVYLVGEGLIL